MVTTTTKQGAGLSLAKDSRGVFPRLHMERFFSKSYTKYLMQHIYICIYKTHVRAHR